MHLRQGPSPTRSESPQEAEPTPRSRHVELAQQVLEVALESGWLSGGRMSEQWLASRCNVSRTPIRKSLQLLAQRGIVVADPSGGYRLACDPSDALRQSAALPHSEEKHLVQAIVRDLAAGRIATSQTVIGLQRRYQASRVSVQGALQRLMENQVVERAAGQQWLFKPVLVGEEDQVHSDEFRLLVAPAALLAPGFRPDPVALSALRQGLEQLLHQDDGHFDAALFEHLDTEFDRLLARGCANPFLADALLVHLGRRAFMFAPPGSLFRMRQSVNEKLQILAQIEREQLELAADLLRVHIRLSSGPRAQLLGRGVPAPLRTGH